MAALEQSSCPECGKRFHQLLPNQKFCSKQCYQKGHNKPRGNLKEPEQPRALTASSSPEKVIHHTVKNIIHHSVKNVPHQTVKKASLLELGKNPEFLRDSLGRIRYPHKYQFGKPDQPITKPMLQEALEKGKFVHPLAHKSYLMISALIGSRKTEALEIFKEDLHQEGSSLFVKIPAKKHGARGGDLELPLTWMGMDLILLQWRKTKPGKKIWRFSPSTAWRIVKRVFPNMSPHWLRWTVVSELRALKDARQVTTDEIKSWTGIKRDSTIEGYGLKTQAGIHKISEVMGQTAEPQGIRGHLGGGGSSPQNR